MNRKVIPVLGGIILFLGLILAACKPAGAQINDDVKQPSNFTPVTYAVKDCSYGGLFESMTAVDAYTVRFTFCSPEPAFLSKIASGAFGIYPSEFLVKYAGTPTLLEKPIGTGPYMVTEWKRGEEVDFKRFDGYWGDKARVSNLIIRWESNAALRLKDLQNGSVDGIDGLSSSDIAKATKDSSLNLFVRPALNIFYIGMNSAYKPFDIENVRRAIAMGINRTRIVQTYFPPGSEVALTFTPCSVPNGCVGEPWYSFNPGQGRQLLKDAGFPNGFDTVIYYRDVTRSYLPQPGAIAQNIQAQLKVNLNINARIEVVDKTTFLDLVTNGKLDGLHLSGWSTVYPDVTAFLDFHFGLGSPPQFGRTWNDITDALNSGAFMAGDAGRRPYYETANNAIKQHAPVVPVAHSSSAVAFRKTVAGAYASPFNSEAFAVMSNNKDTLIFLQNSEPGSLYCNDETDGDSFRACSQVVESLMRYKAGKMEVEPALATSCVPDDSLREWTCSLRQGVKFQDGTDLDAGDVVTSFYAEWDAASPLHKGSTNLFEYWSSLWGGFLNSTSK